ncbi:hypothetical protein YC2023_068358 [Brassica napus]
MKNSNKTLLACDDDQEKDVDKDTSPAMEVSIDGSSSNHHGEIEGLDLQLSLRANHRGDEDTA